MPLSKIPSSAFETPITEFDDNKIINDLSTLALREASNQNRVFYNSNSQSIDVFQDDSGIDTTTSTARNSAEYVNTQAPSASFIDYDFATLGQPSTTKTNYSQDNNFTVDPAAAVANDLRVGYASNQNGSSYITYDYGKSIEFGNQMTIHRHATTSSVTQFRFQYSTNGSNYVDGNFSGSSQISSDQASGATAGGNFTGGNTSGYLNFNTLPTQFKAYSHTIDINSFTARYLRLIVQTYGGGNSFAGYGALSLYGKYESVSATGNFTGTTITAPSSVSSMGAIITYQDHSGTNALNTDIVLQLSADGGSNYTTATLTALPDFSTGIKMAKVNDVSVTAGTSLKYKISFANQSEGSKEARIRGVSLQY